MSDTAYGVALGVVQGLTEFLPVSSSGHLIVFSWLMADRPIPLTLEVALHLGTLIAVALYFHKDWLRIAGAVWRSVKYRETSFESRILLPALIVGTIPVAVLGLLFKKGIEEHFHRPAVVALPLALFGILLWWIDRRSAQTRQIGELRIRDGVMVGLCQCLALIPGVSRSGSTLIGARMRGLTRADAAKFSFLLGTPATAGAILVESKNIAAHLTEPLFYVGVAVSCVVGCLAISLLLRLLSRRGLGIFAIYRCALAVVIVAMIR